MGIGMLGLWLGGYFLGLGLGIYIGKNSKQRNGNRNRW